ncbi:MAG TPA: hypothetical protein VKX25_14505 [Bryobacteraceae bacterium]|nr:hypothetical protein [Bryobacteraceae bacterium]
MPAAPPPALPFVDWKACPFEGCTYGRWTALGHVDVYDRWTAHRKRIAALSNGDTVTAITGLVVTFRPGIIRMDRDLPEQGLKRGDRLLTYSYRGEGFSAVWFHGRYEPEFDISFAKWPDGFGCGGDHCAATYIAPGKKVWWAEIELESGRKGWVNMSVPKFDGINTLCSLPPKLTR